MFLQIRSLRLSLGAKAAISSAFLALCALGAGIVTIASAATKQDNISVALVTTQNAGDNGPIDSMIAGLAKAKAQYDLDTRFIYVADPANYSATLTNVAQSGFEIVITTFPGMQKPVGEVAPKFPETKFILLFGDPYDPPLTNARVVTYDVYPGIYLSGIVAATLSKTGKIGYVGGVPLPALAADYNAYVAGARSVNKKVRVKGAWVGSFQDPVKGHAIGSALYASGVDVIQGEAAASNIGILKAAAENRGYFIDAADPPQILKYSRDVATSSVQFGKSLYNQLTAALKPAWNGGNVHSGLKDGVIQYYFSATFLKKGPRDAVARLRKAIPRVQKATRAIVAGKLKVPFNTKVKF